MDLHVEDECEVDGKASEDEVGPVSPTISDLEFVTSAEDESDGTTHRHIDASALSPGLDEEEHLDEPLAEPMAEEEHLDEPLAEPAVIGGRVQPLAISNPPQLSVRQEGSDGHNFSVALQIEAFKKHIESCYHRYSDIKVDDFNWTNTELIVPLKVFASNIRELTEEKLIEVVDQMYEYFGGVAEVASLSDVTKLATALYPEDLKTPADIIQFISDYYGLKYYTLWLELASRQLTHPSKPEAHGIERKMVAIRDRMIHVANFRETALHIRNSYSRGYDQRFSVFHTLIYNEIDDKKLNAYRRALLLVQNHCFLKRYKRVDNDVYEPIQTREGVYVHAYSRRCTVEELVNALAGNPATHVSWHILNESPTLVRNIIETLRNSVSVMFPVLHRDREFFAFVNGVYSLASDRLIRHSEASDTIVAIKFFNVEFDDFDSYRSSWTDAKFMDIPTPSLDVIFDKQWQEKDESKVWFAFSFENGIIHVALSIQTHFWQRRRRCTCTAFV